MPPTHDKYGSGGYWHGAAQYGPEELASFWPLKRAVAADVLASAITQYDHIKSLGHGLRCLDGDRLYLEPYESFDPVLLRQASGDWKRALRIMGEAMAAQHGPNSAGMMMFDWRLAALVDACALEADGPKPFWRGKQNVRLPPKS